MDILKRGSRGLDVIHLQEFLDLWGYPVAVDGDFGPATHAAVLQFQKRFGLQLTGVVEGVTWTVLNSKLEAAKAQTFNGLPFNHAVVECAYGHFAQEPREVGTNRGPWVRLYCDGREGEDWLWCAAFCHYVIKQVSRQLHVPMPTLDAFPDYTSCDKLARYASMTGRLLRIEDGASKRVQIGDLFVLRRTADDWVHAGIVVGVDVETVTTLEGNTNQAGSRNGDRVRQKTRSFAQLDFVRVGPNAGGDATLAA